MNTPEILVIDDEVQIQKLLEITLQTNNYNVVLASTAREGLAIARSRKPAMILLDIGLPDESGHSVLKKLREWYNSPIIILSVHQDEANIVTALDNGANDYLVKPFRTGELLARIRSLMRSPIVATNKRIKVKQLEIDFELRVLKKNDAVIKLTATEFELMSLFVQNEGKVLTHQYLLRHIWGPGHVEQSQYLRVFIGQLRKKLESEPNHPEYILTESGVGYRFVGE